MLFHRDYFHHYHSFSNFQSDQYKKFIRIGFKKSPSSFGFLEKSVKYTANDGSKLSVEFYMIFDETLRDSIAAYVLIKDQNELLGRSTVVEEVSRFFYDFCKFYSVKVFTLRKNKYELNLITEPHAYWKSKKSKDDYAEDAEVAADFFDRVEALILKI